jgi:hypothetical protein
VGVVRWAQNSFWDPLGTGSGMEGHMLAFLLYQTAWIGRTLKAQAHFWTHLLIVAIEA